MAKVLGVDFDAKKASFILVEKTRDGVEIGLKERLELKDTRDRTSLSAVRDSIRKVIADTSPRWIAIRAKPENGQMRAGAAALKMEALVLAESPVEVVFVSTVKAHKQPDAEGIFAYLQPAYKAALASFERDADEGGKPKTKRKRA